MLKLSLHANGIPPGQEKQFRAVANAAIKAGCSQYQAVGIAKLAYLAKMGFHWSIAGTASGLEIHTRLGN